MYRMTAKFTNQGKENTKSWSDGPPAQELLTQKPCREHYQQIQKSLAKACPEAPR